MFVILFSIQTNGQNSTKKKQFRIDLLTVEKTTNDTIISSIIEIYSGEKESKLIYPILTELAFSLLKQRTLLTTKFV